MLDLYHFKTIPDLSRLQQEFDDFTKILKNAGVKIIYMINLLGEIKYPNFLFTRDILTVSNQGLIVMSMAVESRKNESFLVKEAMKKHIPVYIEISNPGKLEGGDVLFVDNKTVAVGYGPRSNHEGLQQFIQGFQDRAIEEIICIPLANYRVHLDGAFMIVDDSLCIIHEPSVSVKEVSIVRREGIRRTLFMNYLREKKFDFISVSREETTTFGPNVFAIEPGKVISYEWNTRIIRELEKKHVEVIPIKGTELAKGGGGPHCLTCPILRE